MKRTNGLTRQQFANRLKAALSATLRTPRTPSARTTTATSKRYCKHTIERLLAISRTEARKPVKRGPTAISSAVLYAGEVLEYPDLGPVVLDPAGMEFRSGKRSIPLCVSRQDAVTIIHGSVDSIVRSVENTIIGTLSFASDPEAQLTRRRFEEGHINSSMFRLQFQPLELRGGDFIRGVGVVTLVTRWKPLQYRWNG